MAASAPWKGKLLQSLEANKSLVYSKYVQLATVRPDGWPANRTVVFRGFLNDTDDLTFVTDRRSKKVEEVAHNPRAEVAWYFPESREQYRLTGKLTIVGEGHSDPDLLQARQAAWSAMSPAGRLQFTWPDPRLPRDPDPAAFSKPTPGPEAPLPTFCLVVLKVTEVDYVQLFDNYRATFLPSSTLGQGWDMQEINP